MARSAEDIGVYSIALPRTERDGCDVHTSTPIGHRLQSNDVLPFLRLRKAAGRHYILNKRFDIDISKEPMLIYPTLHYQAGGLEFQNTGETCVPGLFLAGEVASASSPPTTSATSGSANRQRAQTHRRGLWLPPVLVHPG